MKIAFDIMGGDNPITEAIAAARKFKKKFSNVSIVLVGNQNQIFKHIEHNEFEVVHADEIVEMTDTPLNAMRKVNSSMYQAIKLVADHKADGVLSAGCTPCYVALLFFLLKPIEGIRLLGFAPTLPTLKNRPCILCDCGANINCEANDLLNFAKMANIYSQSYYHIENPKIGLINIGSEEHKGLPIHSQSAKLLESDPTINYVGFIESNNILSGVIDVAICDGYTGNLVLKSLESGLKTISILLKDEFKKPTNWFGAIFSFFAIKSIKKRFDYRNYAGAVILGLNAPAVKTHGSADTLQFFSALTSIYKLIEAQLAQKIKKVIKK